ncbi:hypothetical protein HPB48_004109 [Haemaphysalis longicornis]|uniref:Uncharacterized protein n=1 Tax=Haemaphysalis longicornis TaxID=44386 RepID=A0A9J6FPC5_HAELO|nr:hypothetical protein HPB48_004109 [Haemaphysalis longicornis]
MKLRRIQEEMESCTNQLASEQWMDTCEQMDGRTNSARSWVTLRALLGQRKANNAAARVALREGGSAQVMAEKAANIFPQTFTPNADTYDMDSGPPDAEVMNSPFTMNELEHAIQRANVRSAAGFGGVGITHVKNLPTAYKKAIPQEFNLLRMSRTKPDEWLHSIVKPMSKPGKPPSSFANLVFHVMPGQDHGKHGECPPGLVARRQPKIGPHSVWLQDLV